MSDDEPPGGVSLAELLGTLLPDDIIVTFTGPDWPSGGHTTLSFNSFLNHLELSR